ACRDTAVAHGHSGECVRARPARAPRALRGDRAGGRPQPQVAGLDLDDWHRRHHLRLPRPAPADVQVRPVVSERRARRPQPVCTAGRGLPAPGLRGLLRHLHGARGDAPAARAVERVPVAGPDAAQLDRSIPAARRRAGRPYRRRVRADPGLHLSVPMKLDAAVPAGPLADKWDRHKFESKLVNPANRRRHTVIVVGTGLAGASAAASLGELGYNVLSFCIQDSARRAHSIAAQGGINAAKNYQNDGDSAQRLFYDTIKGGDYRSREANVYRLAQLSVNIIDQCVAQGVPLARAYGGQPDNRAFGAAPVSRTFLARAQAGQQLVLGAYQSLMRQVESRTVKMFTQREMLDLVVVDGRARGIICRNLVTGAIERYVADAVCLATGGYGTAYYLSTNAVGSNVTAAWRAHKRGALFANPCFTQIHP